MIKIAQSHSQHSLLFDSINPKPFKFKLFHSAHFEHRDTQFIQLKLEVDTSTLAEVLDSQWFNYSRALVLHDAKFTKDSPIVLTIVLSPSVTVQLLEQNFELEHFLAALFKVNDEHIHIVSQQEHWFLVEAKQLVNTSDRFEADNVNALYVGFKTSWYNLLVEELILERQPVVSNISRDTLIDGVTSFLQQRQLNYTVEETNVYIELNSGDLVWTEIIRVSEENHMITCYAKFPTPVPLDQLDRVALIMMNENYSLTNGAFELDYEDGDLRYRSTIVTLKAFDELLLALTLDEHIDVMKQYIPALKQYLTVNRG